MKGLLAIFGTLIRTRGWNQKLLKTWIYSGRSSVCCPQMASLLYRKKKKKTCHFRFLFFIQGLCDVTPEGYHHLTKLLMNLANGKVVVALEVKQFTTL